MSKPTISKANAVLACALSLIAWPAAAQQHDHAAMQMQDMPGMDMSPPKTADPKAPAKPAKPTKKSEYSIAPVDPHAGHPAMGTPAGKPSPKPARPASHPAPSSPDPHASHAMPAGMAMPQESTGAMDHAHMAHMYPSAPLSVFAPPTPAERAAAFPDLGNMDMSSHMDEDPRVAVLRGDRLEHVEGGTTAWDLRFGVGNSYDKFWLRSEGQKTNGQPSEGDVELQWSHATGPWWDRVVSLRSDFRAGPSRQWIGIGAAGLAPYKFEVQAHAYLGSQGRLATTLEGEYELLLTHRLILQPRLELRAYSRDDPANRIGQGLSSAEGGLRLRYEFTPQFAPYVGYGWTHHFGQTADLLRDRGEQAQDRGWVAGLRFWF